MSAYLTLADTDYVSPSVTLNQSLIVQASSIIDGLCRRSLEVTSYTERIPLVDSLPGGSGYQRGHLTYFPVVAIISAKGRPQYNALSGNFFGPPGFEDIADLSVIDVDKQTGSVACGFNPFGSPYSELEVTYTSGWEVIPDAIKAACGLFINQLAANPNANVKSKKDFDFSIEYFGNSYVTPDIADLLRPFILHSFR
ncbi:hypothetical protein PC41400_21605 [Paenibacillus chitinolyticus]|uniref:Uncharacterized protein n=1 Tax=Paenibacillus chitinolyticus TaxID=79263 RepID=A0A410X089_9BACL|nr:hypothetical protein [Paenibacillus chitinolyticus]MCY9593726.1 hypothetical protein [Paenibacillus chitinolyticus]MCY9599708.1 hypothetical protein [Paenibacillus chitinolyticus]QAV20118.1 hypothetical protein PC41400_21605 [Paenibacillus chitinolyticus]